MAPAIEPDRPGPPCSQALCDQGAIYPLDDAAAVIRVINQVDLTMSYNIRLLIDCPDHKGLIAAISSFIALHNGNILSADQHVSDPPNSTFFMRMEIESKGFGLGRDEFDAAFAPLARQHGMNWRVGFTDRPKRMAILVSKQGHCLIDLLWRWEAGELDAEIPLVISNHADLAPKVEAHGIPFHHLPVTKASKAEQEAKVVEALAGA